LIDHLFQHPNSIIFLLILLSLHFSLVHFLPSIYFTKTILEWVTKGLWRSLVACLIAFKTVMQIPIVFQFWFLLKIWHILCWVKERKKDGCIRSKTKNEKGWYWSHFTFVLTHVFSILQCLADVPLNPRTLVLFWGKKMEGSKMEAMMEKMKVKKEKIKVWVRNFQFLENKRRRWILGLEGEENTEALTCQLFFFFDFLFFLLVNYTRGIKKINKYTDGMPRMVDSVKIDVLQKGVDMGGHFCHFFRLNCTFGPLSFQKLRFWPPN